MRAALPLLFFSLPLFGAEITPWDRLKDAATEFIKARSETKKDAAWEKSWKTRLEDRMESTRLSRDAVAQALALDWMTDQRKALEAKQTDAILEACRLFRWFHAESIALPALVREGLEQEDRMLRLSEYLLAQVSATVAAAKSPSAN